MPDSPQAGGVLSSAVPGRHSVSIWESGSGADYRASAACNDCPWTATAYSNSDVGDMAADHMRSTSAARSDVGEVLLPDDGFDLEPLDYDDWDRYKETGGPDFHRGRGGLSL